MGPQVDLTRLDALYAAAELGPMESVHIISPGFEHCANLCSRLPGHKSDYPVAMMDAEWADYLAAIHNAYPALRDEILALRERVLREAAVAIRAEGALNAAYQALRLERMAEEAAKEARNVGQSTTR